MAKTKSNRPKAALSSKARAALDSVVRHPFTDDENEQLTRIQVHTKINAHWSQSVTDWPKNRFDPLRTAPTKGHPILNINIRTSDGRIIEGHWAEDLSGEFQPPFKGWFDTDLTEISNPAEWQPIFASFNEEYPND